MRASSGLQTSCCILTWWKRAREPSQASFVRTLIPFLRTPHSRPEHFPRPSFLIPSHWLLEFQHMNFEGKHSVHNILSLFPIPKIHVLITCHQFKSRNTKSHLKHLNEIWVRFKVKVILGEIPIQLWTYEIKQVMCFQNTMMRQAYDRHFHSKRET